MHLFETQNWHFQILELIAENDRAAVFMKHSTIIAAGFEGNVYAPFRNDEWQKH